MIFHDYVKLPEGRTYKWLNFELHMARNMARIWINMVEFYDFLSNRNRNWMSWLISKTKLEVEYLDEMKLTLFSVTGTM